MQTHNTRQALGIPDNDHIENGDILRNINSFEYLHHILQAIPLANAKQNIFDELLQSSVINSEERKYFAAFDELMKYFRGPPYDEAMNYGDLYTHFMSHLEDDCLDISKLLDDKLLGLKKEMDNLQKKSNDPLVDKLKINLQHNIDTLNKIYDIFLVIHENPNQALERSGEMMKDVIKDSNYISKKIQTNITERLKGMGKSLVDNITKTLNHYFGHKNINMTTPQQEGSLVGRLKSVVGPNYKPQNFTGMNSQRLYGMHSHHAMPQEIRSGTQGQRHQDKHRVNPLFKVYLKRLAQRGKQMISNKNDSKQEVLGTKASNIIYVYFNNLGRDRTDMEGKNEASLTAQLESLQSEHYAVITLPADQGLFDKKFSHSDKRNNLIGNIAKIDTPVDATMLKQRIIAIASDNYLEDPVYGNSKDKSQFEKMTKDFFIPKHVKQILYGNSDKEKEKLTFLYNETLRKLGFKENETDLTEAQQQAIYVHFIKFELTNTILTTLYPDKFNISCKDGIDRGGIASAYYNLIKSIEIGHCLSKDEFYRALHAASTLVKGRGINEHADILWNAINTYVRNPAHQHIIPIWLKKWCFVNNPKDIPYKDYINTLYDFIEKTHSQQQHLLGSHHNGELQYAQQLLALLEGNKLTLEEIKALEKHLNPEGEVIGELCHLYNRLQTAGFTFNSYLSRLDKAENSLHD